jgi:transposase
MDLNDVYRRVHFRKWQQEGVWEQIPDSLVVDERVQQARVASPSLVIFDSQSVKKMHFISLDSGIDGGKNVKGLKRHLAVDTLGLPWALTVTAANISDTAAGCELIDQLRGKVPRLAKITADHGYKPTFSNYGNQQGWLVEIVQRPESSQGFIQEKNRWPVERSFALAEF